MVVLLFFGPNWQPVYRRFTTVYTAWLICLSALCGATAGEYSAGRITMSNKSTRRRRRRKTDWSKKPYPAISLPAHASGKWQKRIGGIIRYFGNGPSASTVSLSASRATAFASRCSRIGQSHRRKRFERRRGL
jgi:hypothetical protein